MSTAVALTHLEAAGLLRRFVARSRRPSLRRLYLTRHAWDQATNPRSSIGLFGLLGEVEAAMAHWTLGDLVYADGRGEPSFLKRLEEPPPEVWNIRVTQPRTQVRLFGRFVEPDALIVTHAVLRGDLSRKGRRSPKKWTAVMNACVASWNGLGLGAPFAGASVHAYVTENCDDFSL
jgi:hypothetical protein